MKISAIIMAAFILALLPAYVFAQQVQFQLDFKIAEHYQGKSGEESKTEVNIKQGPSIVTLALKEISVRSGDNERVYDFSSNTLAYVDHSQKQFLKISLYAIPAFKDYEKRNRQMLSTAGQKAGIESLGTNQFELEMMFGADVDGYVAKNIEVRREGKAHKFYYEGEEVVSYQLSERAIPQALADIYKKYLTYEHNVHSVIVENLSASGLVFSSFQYRNKQVVPFLTKSAYVLASSNGGHSKSISMPENYQETYASDQRLDKVIRLAKAQKEKSVDYYASRINKLFDMDKYIEASLVFHEYSIHHGLKDIDKIKPAIQRVFKQSPPQSGLKNLTAAISRQPSSRQGMQEAIKLIEDAQSKVSAHGYVLNVYLANYYDAIGQNKKAIDLILKALEQNPFLTGAYRDLGNKYFKAYEMPDAWASWDQMRRVNPDHQLALDINNMEQAIRQQHPAYFQ